jgi:hypothetical protein
MGRPSQAEQQRSRTLADPFPAFSLDDKEGPHVSTLSSPSRRRPGRARLLPADAESRDRTPPRVRVTHAALPYKSKPIRAAFLCLFASRNSPKPEAP